jgi:hypothetical protein
VTRCSGVAATRRGRGQQHDDCGENRLHGASRDTSPTSTDQQHRERLHAHYLRPSMSRPSAADTNHRAAAAQTP